MSLSQDLRNQFVSEKKQQTRATEIIQMLGFIGSAAAEIITQDMEHLLRHNKFYEMDGYILALSRIMKHDLALACLQKVYQEVPQKYLNLFKSPE